MKQLKILIHSHLFPNACQPTVGYFVYYPARELARMGHDVSVVSPLPWAPPLLPASHPWHRYREVETYREQDGMKIYHPRFFAIPKNRFYYWRGELIIHGAARFYRQLFREQRFDIIHCHVPLPDGEIGMKLSRRYGIPYGVTIHGGNIYIRIHEHRWNYERIKKVIENAHFVGMVSGHLKSLVLKNRIYPPEALTRVIYNGIHPPENISAASWPDAGEDVVRMLTVCHTIKRKGIAQVLEALQGLRGRFPRLRYYVIGDGTDYHYFRRLARELRVDDITFFLGAMPNEAALAHMKACDIFVLPSWNEAFGVVYAEAMGLGKLTIGSRGEAIDGIIIDGENGYLVEPRNPRDLQRKLETILPQLPQLSHIGENARSTIWPRFSWPNYCREYLALYEQAMAAFGKSSTIPAGDRVEESERP